MVNRSDLRHFCSSPAHGKCTIIVGHRRQMSNADHGRPSLFVFDSDTSKHPSIVTSTMHRERQTSSVAPRRADQTGEMPEEMLYFSTDPQRPSFCFMTIEKYCLADTYVEAMSIHQPCGGATKSPATPASAWP